MRYEQDTEKWTEWTVGQILFARQKAFEHLGMAIDHNYPNSKLCEALGLPVDVFRPQRLIKWANEAA